MDSISTYIPSVFEFKGKAALNILRVIKSRRMGWAGHVARMGEERGVYRVLVGKLEGRNHWGDLGVDG